MNPSPEGAAPMVDACETGDQLLRCLLKLREEAHQGPGKYHPPVGPDLRDVPELPNHWTWASPSQLSSAVRHALAIGPFGSNLKVSDYQDEGVPLVFVRNIRSEAYADGTKFVSESKAKELASHTVDPGDILVTKMGEPPGDSSIYPIGAPKAVITADCIKWRVAPDLNPKFFMYALRSETTKRQIATRTRGVAQKKVSLERFRDLALPLPPLPEQRRIVARIEELFSRLDAGVAALRHAKAQLQRYRQSVLAAAVTGQLTQAWRKQHPDTEPAKDLLERVLTEREATWAGRGKYEPPSNVENGLETLPESWVWTTLAHLANHIADGTHKTPTYVDTGVPFLSAKDVKGFKLSFDNCRYIPREEHEVLIKRCCPKPGNVLVTKSGTIGRIAVVKTEDEFSLFESVANVPLIEPLFSDFIAYASHVGIAGAFGAKNKKGVAVRHLHLEDLRRLPIPLPPLAEQHQIVAEVEARTTAIDHLEAELDRQIIRSNRLRQSILAKAFAGEI